MGKIAMLLGACAVFGAGLGWLISAPERPPAQVAQSHTADAENGALVFAASGCASCHTAPQSQDKEVLAGGYAFDSAFGTFYAPNISWGAEGIGDWTLVQFAHALRAGVSPEGRHYYPAFPYTAYTRMTDGDVADLFAYMGTLPADPTPSLDHEVSFPFNIRRGVGIWKRLYLTDAPVMVGDLGAPLDRGRYLVEGLAHCAECHTERDALGGLNRAKWLQGAPNPSGKGRIPDITPSALGWSAADLAEYFKSGFTPDYDSVGGSMVAVVENLAKLPQSDRDAIAAYLLALPASQ
ncbi:cytochrome c [uncultured Sulfitobacter sp.]|uniref:c-type cytochrome n=1 Tax=uncultured Sulfitobacter sp. TaxID=191468 RepID=UPI00260E12EE|nr:cytochrome c [uncultured Sulfitobacter sp.]